MASAVCYALFQIWTRRLKSVGNLQAMVTVQHYCYLLSALPFFILNWLMTWELSGNPSLDFLLRPAVAPTATDLIYLGICAFAVLFFSTASSNAYRSVEASLIAPFEYTAIPLSVFWSIVIWGSGQHNPPGSGWLLFLAGGFMRSTAKTCELALW
jgi:drug/metabolite transporter (DMT)-like permease